MKGASSLRWLATSLLAGGVAAVTIEEINGNKFLSPYNGQNVTGVTGIVTAKGPGGIWIRSVEKGTDPKVSDAIYVYGSALAKNTSISTGDVISISGKVSEYRSDSSYLYLTEIASPKIDAILEHGQTVEPLVIGVDTLSPPTGQYSSLDNGDVFGVPNNQSLVSVVNPELDPENYGLDFWESLVGQLVTVENPVAISKPNQYGDQWVVGSWATTGLNERGGLTITSKDGNPETIRITDPLDGSDNPTETKFGDKLESITGIVAQVYGFYHILPLTNITVVESLSPALPNATSLTSDGACSGLTVGDYNVENFAPSDTAHVEAVAHHIVDYLLTPDLLFIQEIQDNDGATDDGVVESDVTLSTLTAAIEELSGVAYNYTYIAPVNDEDGGEPGGNIRVAYLFRPDVLQLRNPNPGNSTTANEVLEGPELKYNPGRIDPANAAWESSRKPLVAAWETLDGNNTFFTINVHWASKGGSSSIQGDARPPVNGVVAARQAQAEVTAAFIAEILAEDCEAKIIVAGDFNEYPVVQPIEDFLSLSGLNDLDVVAGIPENERYTYLYDMNSQELDHVFVSPALASNSSGSQFEHIHVEDSPPWYSFDGFTFVVTGKAANITESVQLALSSTRYIESLGGGKGDEYPPELLPLVNLCILFETVGYFQPYMALPGFWEVVSGKWGLLRDYKTTRLLIHMCTGARTTFLANRDSEVARSEDLFSSLSKVLACLVDKWRSVYDDYFDLRTKAFEDPDGGLAAVFDMAQHIWSSQVGLSVRRVLSGENGNEAKDSERMSEKEPHQSTTMDVDRDLNEHSILAHDNKSSARISPAGDDNLAPTPVRPLTDTAYTQFTAADGICSQRESASYTYTLDSPPTISPITPPRKNKSPAGLSPGGFDSPQHDRGDDHMPAVMGGHQHVISSRDDISCKAMEQAAEDVHFQLPIRPPTSSSRRLFYSTEDVIHGAANNSSTPEEDVTVDMDAPNDEDDNSPDWEKKGYTYPDAEDPTHINGCKIVGGTLTLTDMIRRYMQKEREKEEAERTAAAAAAQTTGV
ncbi:endonuclease/Exonuclease/phosphatase [Seiridium cupressi]